jgi:hypothetical protein
MKEEIPGHPENRNQNAERTELLTGCTGSPFDLNNVTAQEGEEGFRVQGNLVRTDTSGIQSALVPLATPKAWLATPAFARSFGEAWPKAWPSQRSPG